VHAIGGAAAHASAASLVGRFALVVLVPLAVGLAIRAARPTLERAQGALEGGSSLTVCVLVYAALSGVGSGGALAGAALAAALFLGVSALVAIAVVRVARGRGDPAQQLGAATLGLPIAMRDFAVGSTLATQAFGTSAAAVAGIYGVLMLVTGAVVASVVRRRG
jgi:predicted Na+-dependent transporter